MRQFSMRTGRLCCTGRYRQAGWIPHACSSSTARTRQLRPQDEDGSTPFDLAVQRGSVDLTRFFIEHGGGRDVVEENKYDISVRLSESVDDGSATVSITRSNEM